MKALLKVTAFILVFAGVLIVIDYAVSLFSAKDSGLLLHHGPAQITFYILFIINVFVFQTFVNKESFLALGIQPYPGFYLTVLKGWAVGLIAFAFYSYLMGVFGVVEFHMKWSPRVISAFFIAFSAFGIALTEEILFRGFFLQTMLKNLPKWVAVLITSVIFVLFHDLANIQNFWTVHRSMMLAGGLFSLSVLLCVAYLKSGTLYLPIGIHSGLVFGKLLFKKMKLMSVINPGSYWFGLEGDARRGFLSWLFFLSGILILKFLITDRERKALTQKNA